MWSFILFAAFLLAASGLLLWIHQRAWQLAQREGLDERNFDFRRRQYRRRMQASAMIAVVGVAVLGSLAVTDPIMTAILWIVVLVLVGWMLLLAFADMISSMLHYKQLRAEYAAEHASLQAQLERSRKREGNGQAQD